MHKLKFLLFVFALVLAMSTGINVLNADAGGPNPVVIMETTMGRIIVMLDPKKAPLTVENFLRYVDAGFYDGTIFHRVMKQEFDKNNDERKRKINIVQGGGFEFPLRKKMPLWSPIKNESGGSLQNTKGTIAMARAASSDSATCQFFFNMENNTSLNPLIVKKKTWGQVKDGENEERRPGYCAFGKVIRGWDVVEKIHNVKTTKMGRYSDVPAKPVYIKKAYRAK